MPVDACGGAWLSQYNWPRAGHSVDIWNIGIATGIAFDRRDDLLQHFGI